MKSKDRAVVVGSGVIGGINPSIRAIIRALQIGEIKQISAIDGNINLSEVGTNDVVIIDQGWNPQIMEAAIQQNPYAVYLLISESSFMPYLMQRVAELHPDMDTIVHVLINPSIEQAAAHAQTVGDWAEHSMFVDGHTVDLYRAFNATWGCKPIQNMLYIGFSKGELSLFHSPNILVDVDPKTGEAQGGVGISLLAYGYEGDGEKISGIYTDPDYSSLTPMHQLIGLISNSAIEFEVVNPKFAAMMGIPAVG